MTIKNTGYFSKESAWLELYCSSSLGVQILLATSFYVLVKLKTREDKARLSLKKLDTLKTRKIV